MRNSFKVKGQDHQADIILRPEVRHIFRTERLMNFRLGVQMEAEHPYRPDGPSPARWLRSRCHVVRMTGLVLAHKSRMKSLRNIKVSK